ncbi:monooxygenase [Meiothermus sp. QL-1]|uniref:NAD(P)/FAD-dependent oxidoreductase n=1 Tax=Meiothermus sp. QL-1 TaxID=2058095 RepID=UPI000E0B8A73|nr:NAD(P)/FAD-dependent oxidoreductase [Meiothermus sp. QL-1]RDI96564.1 monooxygenase [Meiothermus sp. QL-1]
MERVDVAIVGAGPAGVGVGLALKRLGVGFRILERHTVGASFRRWPAETRFITPSFTANAFGLPDLNAVSPETSPAFTLRKEHPSGPDYARYLQALVRHYALPVATRTAVEKVQPLEEGFRLTTSQGPLEACFLVWATGEFQFPRQALPGLHYGQVRSWARLPGERFVVVGGYESGLDAACNLVALGKRVQVFDPKAPWARATGEPSVDVSPYTLERLQQALATGRLELVRAAVRRVEAKGGSFILHHTKGAVESPTPPILATGFGGGLGPVEQLFAWQKGHPILSEAADESTRTPGLFLAGPGVRHRGTAFCFIYKFRGRLPLVASAIAERLGVDSGPLEPYRARGMWADDLAACCTSRCAC